VSERVNAATGSDRVSRLVVLPLRKSVEIAYKSIRVRFFRSLITIMSLVLAVSFLSFVRVSNDTANGLLATSDNYLRQKLIRSGYDLTPEDTSVGSSPKQRWIIMGIVNAQLMAVTERFREIGTMKCLGALDRFILRLFLLEAAMQGLAGAAAGSIIGAAFSLMNAVLHFGGAAFSNLEWGDVLTSILFSTGVGCFLSLLGVLYPAILAARMQPVEAMRVEQ